MSIKELEEKEMGPFTLEEAKKMILDLEETATEARNVGQATRYLFTQLLKTLHQAKIIDGVTFLENVYIDNNDPDQRISEPALLDLEVLIALLLQEFRRQENVSQN